MEWNGKTGILTTNTNNEISLIVINNSNILSMEKNIDRYTYHVLLKVCGIARYKER